MKTERVVQTYETAKFLFLLAAFGSSAVVLLSEINQLLSTTWRIFIPAFFVLLFFCLILTSMWKQFRHESACLNWCSAMCQCLSACSCTEVHRLFRRQKKSTPAPQEDSGTTNSLLAESNQKQIPSSVVVVNVSPKKPSEPAEVSQASTTITTQSTSRESAVSSSSTISDEEEEDQKF